MCKEKHTIKALIVFVLSLVTLLPPPASACCPAFRLDKPVVNADQTVLIIWDPATKTQHFIRQASFKSDAEDFGFLVPTPTQPELEESGNEVFPLLRKKTEPEKIRKLRPLSLGCMAVPASRDWHAGAVPAVRVLDEKLVAGFNTVVLETKSANALANWLREHEYAFSPEVEAWAKPYVDNGWKITALKVAKDDASKEKRTVAASSLRISFKTDRPVFPYREGDPTEAAKKLGVTKRLLRIYFIADARYRGEAGDVAWSGKVVWSNKLTASDRGRILELLKLPKSTGPATWWLTEFEDDWAYRSAPADVYFSRAARQQTVKRPPVIEYVKAPSDPDATVCALSTVLIIPPLVRRVRRVRRA